MQKTVAENTSHLLLSQHICLIESNNVGIIQGEFLRHFETKTIRLDPEKKNLKLELLEKKVVMTEFYEGN